MSTTVTTSTASITDRVLKIVSEQMGVALADIKLTSNFQEDLGADSLDAVELLMGFEDEFEIEIEDAVGEKLTTVQMVIDYVTANPK